ncbi:MAG: GGDEF domain-containing protein, partial [Lachnospiraceae bacterium]|nr:GGDEF domain-containing protein [Lachnospiraceae bacterium]
MLNFKKIVVGIFCFLTLAAIVTVIYNAIEKSAGDTYYGLEFTYSIDEDWSDSEGNTFVFKHLNRYEKDSNGYVTAYYNSSEKLAPGDSICFMSVDCLVSVYCDGNLIYETEVENSSLYSKSPGTRWNIVNIPEVSKRHNINMKIKPVYSTGCQIGQIMIGDRGRLILDIFANKIIDLFISSFLLILGVIAILYGIILNWKKDKEKEANYEMSYLGAFIIIGGIWSLAETGVLQLIANDIQQVSQIAQMSFMYGIIPMLLYLDCTNEIFRYKIVKIILCVNCLYIMAVVSLLVLEKMDMHEATYGTMIFYVLLVTTIMLCVGNSGRRFRQPDGSLPGHIKMRNVGLTSLALGIVIDMIRYGFSGVDKAKASRIGLLIVVTLVGVGTVYHSIMLVQTGMRSEIISHLAYTDGLTEVGNRTAFDERLEALINANDGGVGIVALDVNNLKKINDNLGHAEGDRLICGAVSMIKEAFSRHGSIYRTGGDEFTVIIYDDEADQLYEDGRKVFEKRMKEYNNRKDIDFSIVIAHGFAFSETSDKES